MYPAGNVAYGKPAEGKSASTGVWFRSNSAGKAVDGRTGSYGSSEHCYVADYDGSVAWWMVDLEELHAIYSVYIYNMLPEEEGSEEEGGMYCTNPEDLKLIDR